MRVQNSAQNCGVKHDNRLVALENEKWQLRRVEKVIFNWKVEPS